MDEMEEKLGAILSNPQMMQQIMTMAQTIGQSAEHSDTQPNPTDAASASLPFDPTILATLSSLAGNTSVDPNQKALLHALRPYLSQDRVTRLEKAMHAARLAKFASVFLNQGGLSFLTGR